MIGIIFLSASIQAQEMDVFRIDQKKEIFLMGGGISLFAVGYHLIFHMNPPDQVRIDKDRIFYLDRFAANFSHYESAVLSDITSGLCAGFPIISLLPSQNRKSILHDFTMYVESVLYIQGLTFLSKAIFKRPRPYAYCLSESQNQHLDASAVRSFFSGHTAVAFNGVVFAGTVFQRRNPHSSWIKPIWILGISVAAATAIFRVTSGNHFPTDVLAGALFGSCTGYLIPHLHKENDKHQRLSVVLGNRIGICCKL